MISTEEKLEYVAPQKSSVEDTTKSSHFRCCVAVLSRQAELLSTQLNLVAVEYPHLPFLVDPERVQQHTRTISKPNLAKRDAMETRGTMAYCLTEAAKAIESAANFTISPAIPLRN